MLSLFSESNLGQWWVGWSVPHRILPVLFNLPTSPESECLNFSDFLRLWRINPPLKLGHLTNGFENAGHQNNPFFLLTFLLWPFGPPLTCFSLSGLTQSQGILGFVDHTGNLLFCPLGTMPQREEDIHQHTGVSRTPSPLPPTTCLYITIAKHHPRPDIFTLSPFFIMRKNRINLAAESLVSHTKCFWCLRCDWRENSLFWDVKRAGFTEENQAVHFWELNFARTWGFTIYDIEKDKC